MGDALAIKEIKPSGTLGYRFIKRLFDLVFSLLMSVLLLIPIAIVCVLISLESPGSPMYTQERVGRGGRTIKIFKLRSMVADAGDVQKYLSPEQLHQWEVERKVDDDPRITKIGQFIRKCSIDEMPQFLNVLNGDLSVIGPRPITRDELEQHFSDEEKAELLSVQPGITGLWQATDRNEATFESGLRQKIELRYVQNRCFAMDDLKNKAAGIRTFPTGFEALMKTEDISGFPNLTIEPATIDEIVVFTSKKGDDYE